TEVRSRAARGKRLFYRRSSAGRALPRYGSLERRRFCGGTRVVPRSLFVYKASSLIVSGTELFLLPAASFPCGHRQKTEGWCTMEEKISALRAQLEADRAAVHNKQELSDFWQKYLSKNGAVTGLTKGLRDVPKE